MTRDSRTRMRILVLGLAVLELHLGVSLALAGPPPKRLRRTVVVNPAQECAAPRRSSTLGTFYPTPYVYVRGNSPVGGGYTPGETYGDQTLSLYGPLSVFRTQTAPVRTYVRGYDGRTRVEECSRFQIPTSPSSRRCDIPPTQTTTTARA